MRSSERRRPWFVAGAVFRGRPGESSLAAVEESTDRRRVRLLTSSTEGSEPSAVLREHEGRPPRSQRGAYAGGCDGGRGAMGDTAWEVDLRRDWPW